MRTFHYQDEWELQVDEANDLFRFRSRGTLDWQWQTPWAPWSTNSLRFDIARWVSEGKVHETSPYLQVQDGL